MQGEFYTLLVWLTLLEEQKKEHAPLCQSAEKPVLGEQRVGFHITRP